MKSIMIVAGTRPEIIKLAPVIKWLEKLGEEYIFVWSGQHYDYELSRIFFEQLRIPEPDEDLSVGSGTHAEQIAKRRGENLQPLQELKLPKTML